MTDAAPLPEDLLTHAAFVRNLARTLLLDPNEAEEVEQETWRAALENPPERGAGMGPWLTRVARTAAFHRRRSEARRRWHERSGAKSEALPSSEVGLAREEILQRVVDAVRALEDPYRSTILARFYEDLSPGAIAAREEISVGTVRTRLRRGIEKLRKRLESDVRDWRCSLALLAGQPQRRFPLKASRAWRRTRRLRAAVFVTAGLLLWWRLWMVGTDRPASAAREVPQASLTDRRHPFGDVRSFTGHSQREPVMSSTLLTATLYALFAAQGYSPAEPRTYRVSLSSNNGEADADCQAIGTGVAHAVIYGVPRVRVVFHTTARLALEDVNDHADVYVRDITTGDTCPVSLALGGNAMGNAESRLAAISADGRYVSFTSSATDLDDQPDSNGRNDIFVRDLDGGMTTRVSVASDGTESNGDSSLSFISATGRFVAFECSATNLDPLSPQPSGTQVQVYVHDRDADGDGNFDPPGQVSTRLVSIDSSGAVLGERCQNPTISADGRFVAFETTADFHPSDANGFDDCYVRDRTLAETFPVSVMPNGNTDGGISDRPWISGDGRWVLFRSEADELLAAVETDLPDFDVFVYGPIGDPSMAPGMVRITEGPNGAELDDPDAQYQSISADGRWVVFDTPAQLVMKDTDTLRDIYAYDRATGDLRLCSVNNRRVPGNGTCLLPGISADGSVISFNSAATNLAVGGDQNGKDDVFLRELRPVRRRP